MRNVLLITSFFLTLVRFANAQELDHSLWTTFLQKQVSKTGQVNYKSITPNNTELNNYLNQLISNAPNKSWSKNETLAYWINAYNAFTIKLVVDNYSIESIKDIKNPWDQKFIPIHGEMISLNYIEHEILRKMKEPRIHFAIVCASVSCPRLLNEAYTADKLEQQLTNATREFLRDTSKNKISKTELELSKIFKWFKSDFEQNGSRINFINQYSEESISNDAKIKYMDYNWDLND